MEWAQWFLDEGENCVWKATLIMFTAGADVLGCYKAIGAGFYCHEGIRTFLICLSAHQRVHAVNIRVRICV